MLALLWILAVALFSIYTYRRQAGSGGAAAAPSGNRLERFVYAVSGAWLHWCGGYQRLVYHVPQLVRICAALYGRNMGADPAYVWTLKTFAGTLGSFVAAVSAFLARADPAIVALTFGLVGAVPALRWRELTVKAKLRREAFITVLPTFMQKLSLLLAAGETIQRAWAKASAADPGKTGHPMYAELARTCVELNQGVPFARALEELQRRCAVPEMNTLVATVLMNYKRGGDTFSIVLRDTARVMTERKHAVIRTKGEEASAKLLFPMLLMLAAVLIVVAAPAVMTMSS